MAMGNSKGIVKRLNKESINAAKLGGNLYEKEKEKCKSNVYRYWNDRADNTIIRW